MPTLPHFTKNLLVDHDLIDTFLSLHRWLEADADPHRQRELLIHSFGSLLERHARAGGGVRKAPKDRVKFRKFERMMREQYDARLLLDDLADAVGLTKFQLIGLFKRVVGLTPHAYLTQLRLQTACQHIRLRMPIAEAAAAAGFCDQSALNHRFKQSYGITPTQLAKAADTRNAISRTAPVRVRVP